MKKKCKQCGEIKSLKDYHRNPSFKNGRTSRCKVCVLKAKGEWYKKNRKEAIKKAKKYRKENRDRIREKHREWREKNRKHYNKIRREYYHRTKNEIR